MIVYLPKKDNATTPEERQKIEAYIAEHGVTTCPGMFTRELAEYNNNKLAAFQAMTHEERVGHNKRNSGFGRGRPKENLTPDERKKRKLDAMKRWYLKNKEKRAAYHRARRVIIKRNMEEVDYS